MPKERIEDLVSRLAEPLAQELGYELVEVEYHKEGPNWVLRCMIDYPAGVGLNECQRFSEALSELLDREDPIPGSYLLEVTSPGVERPLVKDRDFIRFTGNRIEVRLNQPIGGSRRLQGLLTGVRDSENEKWIQIDINGSMMEIPRKTIVKAHLISEIFGREGGRKKQ
ncbi:MAG TPA: ribosome maturation factor RimP [Bacillota bacterium]